MDYVDLTPIAGAIVTLSVALIAAFLLPLIKAKTNSQQFDNILLWTQVAVEAAEMIYEGSGRGEEKKKYVEEFLKSKGFKLDTNELENLIKSAVLELKRAGEAQKG